MGKKKICFIAQFPPPVHGLSKAVDTLYGSRLNNNVNSESPYIFEKIDITSNKRFLKNLFSIIKSNADLYYFTISQTKGGNIRDLIILFILRMQNKKCLIHLHGGYYRKLVEEGMPSWQKRANYIAIKELSGVIVLSQSLRKNFDGMIDESKMYVVENCVDDQYLLTDIEISNKLDAVNDTKILHVLWLSNFIRSKGYDFVLEMALMEKKHVEAGFAKRFHFDFAGKFFDVNEKEYFDKFVKENELYDYITYHGTVDGDKKRSLLRNSHFFALPTRYPNEGQPISILEAMGNGMYVITTDHAGIPDIVIDDVNGIVIHDNDTSKVIYNKIVSLKIDRLKYICQQNRKYCVSNFSEASYISKMEKAFHKADSN